MRSIAAALLIVIASPALAGPRQFDLICTARREAPWSGRVSIDLDAASWCEAACDGRRAIAEVRPDLLILDQSDGLRPDGTHVVRFEVNRTDGGFFRALDTSPSGFVTGQCVAAPFTPFPPTKF